MLQQLTAWSRQDHSGTHQVVTVVEPLTHELLRNLIADPIDALVLVDHAPFATGGAPLSEALPGDGVRDEARRAIFALELARHASRTLPLAGNSDAGWQASLAALLGVPASSDVISDLPSLPPGVTAAEEHSQALDTPLVAQYLLPLFNAPNHHGPLALAWPRECFLHGDAPNTMLPATVEVAGRGRILAYGPYLPLPAGNWRAKTFLGFSPDIGELPFILEVDSGSRMFRGFFEVDRSGIFTLDLDFQITEPLNPVEMRLISQDSALDGQLSLISVSLEQVRSG